MFKNVRLPEPVRRLYRRVEGYFRALIDPSLSVRARIFSGAKGLVAIGALGLALLCAYAVILIPFTPSISNLRKAKIDQPGSADFVRWQAPGDVQADEPRVGPVKSNLAACDQRFDRHRRSPLLPALRHRFAAHRGGHVARLRRQIRRAVPLSPSNSPATSTRRTLAANGPSHGN